MEERVFAYHRDNEDGHWWFVGRRHVLAPLVAYGMKGQDGSHIFDVGCGTGGTVAALSADYNCTGFDRSESAIGMARRKYPQCRFLCGELGDHLPVLAPGTALYTLMDVLEHLEDDRGLLTQIVAAMRPGSRLLITVPAVRALWSEHDESAGHRRRYELSDFQALWHGLDLEPNVVTPFNARLYPMIWAARTLGRRLGLFTGRGGRDLARPLWPINALLTAVFAGERQRVARLIGNPAAKPFRRGASLLALLERRR